MGNKLCAPWRKNYKEDDHWTPRKDSHLLRLWAEIFEVQEENGEICWARVSDDVVPVNITCIQNHPNTVFQVTAYNRHVEKIFDVRLIQPGTRITQASECFVHWKDSKCDHEWGLNFTTPLDARRFYDCCMSAVNHNYSRKAASSGSLGLSPPKKTQNRKSASNPTSPVAQPRRALSSTEEFAVRDAIEAGFVLPRRQSSEKRSNYNEISAIATAPRVHRQARQVPLAQSVFDVSDGRMQRQQVCENIYTQVNRQHTSDAGASAGAGAADADRCHQMPPPSYANYTGMNQPIAEREIPYNVYMATQMSNYALKTDTAKFLPTDLEKYAQPARTDPGLGLGIGLDARLGAKFNGVKDDGLPTKSDSNWAQRYRPNNYYNQELRQFSREPTVLNFLQFKDDADDVRDDGVSHLEHPGGLALNLNPPPKTILKTGPQSAENAIRPVSFQGDALRCEKSPTGASSSTVPSGFDSNTLKRMLQTLPAALSALSANSPQELTATANAVGDRQLSPRQNEAALDGASLRGSLTEEAKDQKHREEGSTGRCTEDHRRGQREEACQADPERQHSCEFQQDPTSNCFPRDETEHGRSTQTVVRNCHTSEIPGRENGANSDEEGPAISAAEAGLFILSYKLQEPFASRSIAVRKTGWLMIQNWLLNKMVTVVVATKRTWMRYWVCLKGTSLLFYDHEADGVRRRRPRHIIVVSGSLVQPHEDHGECENVFSLSTIFGNAYLFQATCQAEMESWLYSIHVACASSFARHLGRDSAAKLLSNEIHKLENSIDLDLKMKKMAGMQVNMISDPSSREALDRQIATWDENLEKLFIEQYQLRCYLAALQNTELPSSKAAMANASKATRSVLSHLKALAPTALHALICARTPLTMVTGSFCHLNKGQQQDQRLLSTFKADSGLKSRPKSPRPLSLQSGNSSGNVNLLFQDSLYLSDQLDVSMEMRNVLMPVILPDNQTLTVGVNEKTTAQDLLKYICSRCHLNYSVYFIRVRQKTGDVYRIPDKSSFILSEDCEAVEVCAKLLFQAEIYRSKKDRDFGFSIEAKSMEDGEQEELCVYISDIGKGMMTVSKKGLHIGDELVVLNDLMVGDLDMVYIETILEECEVISLTVRSCRIIDQLCEIPPGLADHQNDDPDPAGSAGGSSPMPTQLWQPVQLQDKSQQNHLQSQGSYRESRSNSNARTDLLAAQGGEDSGAGDEACHQTQPLNDTQKSCKVVKELIETERQYVKDLNCLIEWYLEPLKREKILTSAEIEHLFGNIQEIAQFQKLFLQSLEEAVEPEEGAEAYNTDCIQFKKVLFSLGSAFLYYAHHFKLYSSFCASHSKAQKILLSENNAALQEFLRSHNPKQQHSATLESYLIKPIQRILKYPLLLRQLKDLTNPHSDEHAHLREALHGMEAVAEHINEMQKIYEENGYIFEEMMKAYKAAHPNSKGLDLNVGELQMYGTVNWLNALEELGKLKKGTELLTLLFIFKSGVVLMAQERLKGKRKPVQGRPSLCGDCTEVARFKIAIPVEQLQVRTMVGDAYECHGIWEMVQCASEKDGQPEKVFQFASSQEARRDFIRTIHQTIHYNVQHVTPQSSISDCTTTADASPYQQTADTLDQSCASRNVPLSTAAFTKRPESLPTEATISRSVTSSLRREISNEFSETSQASLGDAGYRSNRDLQQQQQQQLQHQSQQQQQQQPDATDMSLGSQSTLASDRGGARLVQASHNPTSFSGGSAPKEPIGSPIWKPRQASKNPDRIKTRLSSEEAYPDGRAGEDYGGGGGRAVSMESSRQRVAFKIPPTEHEVKGTDC